MTDHAHWQLGRIFCYKTAEPPARLTHQSSNRSEVDKKMPSVLTRRSSVIGNGLKYALVAIIRSCCHDREKRHHDDQIGILDCRHTLLELRRNARLEQSRSLTGFY